MAPQKDGCCLVGSAKVLIIVLPDKPEYDGSAPMNQQLPDFIRRHETPLVFVAALAVFLAFLFFLIIGPWLLAGR